MRVFTGVNGTITLTDDRGQTKIQFITTGSMQLLTTGWLLGSSTVTVTFSAGWELGIDDLVFRELSSADTIAPTVEVTAPADGATVAGTILVTVDASDNLGVMGVQFLLDGVNLGAEDTAEPFEIQIDTTTLGDGLYTLSARARDAAGNQTTSEPVDIIVDNDLGSGTGFALRFFGNGVNDIDRVKIQIDDPANGLPGPPADVGATDFTLEFWMKASAGENNEPAVACGNNNNWIFGNIIFDRDRYNQDRSYGLSLAGGRLVFGVSGAGTGSFTVCGTTNVLDDAWHHVAIQRRRTDGWMWIYVDGILEAQANGPDGDISYPDNGIPGNFCGPGGNQPCTNSDPYLVIGAEKHDAGAQFPSYSGFIDEVRLSSTLRYSSNFTSPIQPFVPDANTVALYHFDEGQGDLITDSSGAIGGPSHGVRKFGGSPAGPQWVSETPFGLASPPPPAITGLLPTTVAAGGPSFALTVTGSNYVSTSVVRWNGADRATTYSSATQLTATILASDIATAGSAQVTVYTPTPGGGTSNAQTFTITAPNNPVPTMSSVTPSTAIAGGADFTVTVTGSNFVTTSVVRWNGVDRATTYSSPTQLTATILASDIAAVGSAQVTVYTPTPGGGTSNAQTFTITAPNNPVPETSSVTPSTAIAGGAGFTVTVTGSGFVSSSVVRWNGADRATTYGSATQLTATILASDIATAGSAQVTVYTPAPGGGTSNAQTFTITNAVSGLVAAYSFNAGSGPTVADVSGNGNTGTITGATWTTAGRFGSALSFNGSSNMVTVNDANSLDLTTGMTLAAWVYPTVAPSGWRTIVAKERSGGVVYFLHAGSTSNNRPATGVYISNAERQLFGGSRLSANTWTHLAATYDGTTQRLYVNGVQVSSRAQTGAIQTSTNPLRIGGNSPYGEFFQGRIDEVHIYNRALTQAEIQAVMNTPLTP
jgi:hypothetical protein